MANKKIKPLFPMGLTSDEESVFNKGFTNNGDITQSDDASFAVPSNTKGNSDSKPSLVRYNPSTDEFEGGYTDGWRALGGGGIRWEMGVDVNRVYTTELGRGYFIDNRQSISTVKLPANPSRIGLSVSFSDLFGVLSVYPLNINANGAKLYGAAENMVISTDNVAFTFTWTGDEQGWVITAGVGLGSGRVYTRNVFETLLDKDVTHIETEMQPEMVDIYVDGARWSEKGYKLVDTGVDFTTTIKAGSTIQVIEYTPIQLAADKVNERIHDVSVKADKFYSDVASTDGFKMVGRCPTVSVLKTIEPTFHNQKILLTEYSDGYKCGGGEFVYDEFDTTTVEDGGVCFVTAGGKRWKRIVDDLVKLNVTHFGAVPDGKTDSLDAVKRMDAWSQANAPRVGIQFPAGTFYMKPYDNSSVTRSLFRCVGAGMFTKFGYFSMTTLVSDKTASLMFKVKSRWTEFGGFVIEGGNNTTANTQGILSNIQTEGQYVHVHHMKLNYIGGVSFQFVDTLDFKFEEMYSSYCNDSILRLRYSSLNSWDHCTAAKLIENNHQYYQGTTPCLDMPRTTQAVIDNVWIEHAFYGAPMDINNGEWTFRNLNVEDCKIPINAQSARITETATNLQGTLTTVDHSESSTPWLSKWEPGVTSIMASGTKIQGQFAVDLLTSSTLINNEGTAEKWFKLGKAYFPNVNQEMVIEVLGVRGFTTLDATLLTLDGGRDSHGIARLFIQKIAADNFKTTVEYEGSSAVLQFKVVVETSYVTVYARIDKYTRNAATFVRTNGPDRFSAGITAKWSPALEVLTAEPAGTTPQPRFSIHNKLAGIGGNEDGNLVFKTNVVNVTSTTGYTQAGMMSVVLNNNIIWIPIYKTT